MNAAPLLSIEIDMKSPRLRSDGWDAVHPSPCRQTGFTWIACGVAWVRENVGLEPSAFRLCAKAMNHGPEFCASGAGFVVVYQASAARPGEPATIEVKTPFAPA